MQFPSPNGTKNLLLSPASSLNWIFTVNLDWQLVVVAACLIWAVAVLSSRCYRLVREPSSNGCGSGGCHDCPSNTETHSSGLIQLQIPTQKRAK
jgi:hypothetical protein